MNADLMQKWVISPKEVVQYSICSVQSYKEKKWKYTHTNIYIYQYTKLEWKNEDKEKDWENLVEWKKQHWEI